MIRNHVRTESENDKGDTMKDKKKKKQKSEEKLKKKKAALLPDEKAEKEGQKKKKQKQLSENEGMKSTDDIQTSSEMEAVASAPAQKEKASKKAGKSERKYSADAATQDEAAFIFRALGDETRLRIVGMLEEHELCAADLLKSVSIVQSTLSHHMKILCDSGAVNCRREGRWSYYSINVEVMEKAADYLKKYRKA